MTRRRFIALTLPCVTGATGCDLHSARVRARLDKLETDEGLGVIAEDAAALLGEPFPVYTLTGTEAGQLMLPHISPVLSMASDARCIAWASKKGLPFPFGESDTPSNNELPEILLAACTDTGRVVRYGGGFARQLAVSSGGSRLVLTTVADGGRLRRLVMLSTDQGRAPSDLTELVNGFSLAQTERLKVSGTTQIVALGSRTSFIVLDIEARKLLFEAKGRFPSVSPNGEIVAFVDDNKLYVRTVRGGELQQLLPHVAVDGVGAWSPDSNLLLAGVRPLSLGERSLVAVDRVGGEFCEIMKLGSFFGDRFAWINKLLLSAKVSSLG